MLAQLISGIRRYMVKFVHGDQAVVELLHSKLIDSKAQRCMGTDQHLVIALQEHADGIQLAAVIPARCVTEIPLGSDFPVRPEPVLRQQLVVETRTDGPLRHDDNGLLAALIL
jgi:hypothetical protein